MTKWRIVDMKVDVARFYEIYDKRSEEMYGKSISI